MGKFIIDIAKSKRYAEPVLKSLLIDCENNTGRLYKSGGWAQTVTAPLCEKIVQYSLEYYILSLVRVLYFIINLINIQSLAKVYSTELEWYDLNDSSHLIFQINNLKC